MFENNLIAGVSGQGGGYNIEDSLRFNDNDSAYLSRTPSVAGDRKTWTWSKWVKRGNLVDGRLFHAGGGTTDTTWLDFGFNGDRLRLSLYNTILRTSTAVLRDSSGWYHIVVHLDTTQSTASNRVKIYLNGVEITAFDDNNNPTLNGDYAVNTTTQHNIGRSRTSSYFDGYMAEINFIDGQALTADDFGQIDATTGEWSPKAYEGTYGTNGFYLEFKDGAALGDDTSGNTNDWTPTNLASTDQMLDTPTNNFAVLNSVAQGSYVTLSEGNLKITGNTATDSGSALPTMFVNEGLFYWETCVANVGSGLSYAGFVQTNAPVIGTTSAETIGTSYGGAYRKDGNIYGANRAITTTDTYTAGDIIGIALDMTNGAAYVSKNNTWLNSGVPTSGASKTGAIWSWTPASMIYANGPLGAAYNGEASVLNTGADSSFAGLKTRQGNTDANGIGDFYYTPPTGYLALCTDNLPAPAIEQPETQFNVVTWTGTGTGSRSITGVGFQPDFVWLHVRNKGYAPLVYDSVRGGGSDKDLTTYNTNAEGGTNADLYDYLTSFDSDGFSSTWTGTDTPYYFDESGTQYVAWCWKAGGTAVSNTDGSITSQVSANVDAGFSVVGYTGTGSNASVGHGLSVTPDLVIVKNRDFADMWRVWHTDLSDGTYYLNLNATSAQASNSSFFTGLPTTSVFNIGTDTSVNRSGDDHIAYCFHSVEGFSKFGSYVGNGSTNGTFVYTGFKPAFLMVKRTDSTSPWLMYDNERNTFNQTDNLLRANTIDLETGSGELDFLSNGFKYRGSSTNADYVTNVSGGTYIYMAFAEHPFNYATGR